MVRRIIHIDMDCFYAAVEEKYDPSLKGKPVAVGGPAQSRSVLCTANYEARKFGVRAAQPSSLALRKCPELIIIPPHFDRYKKESHKIHQIFHKFTTKIEPMSLDEAYLDVTDSSSHIDQATEIAWIIKNMIRAETGLNASAGIAPNKLLSKIAGDWGKPNGLFTVAAENAESFLSPMVVDRLPGIGPKTKERLQQVGIETIEQLKHAPFEVLAQTVGTFAVSLKKYAIGQDHREVITDWERKSLTVEQTYEKDFHQLEAVLEQVPELYEDWHHRFSKDPENASRIKSWVVKVRFSDFRRSTLEQSSSQVPKIHDFKELFKKIWARDPGELRLLGLGVRFSTADKKKELPQEDQLQLKFGNALD
ncbi:MAG: DNA polymerase IV [Pseudobdellovibrionaceae bacterium]